jgi:hypothetical protein
VAAEAEGATIVESTTAPSATPAASRPPKRREVIIVLLEHALGPAGTGDDRAWARDMDRIVADWSR